MSMIVHHIQRGILDKLSSSEALRYSDLKPEHLDGNVFGYHLKRLITDTYVSQNTTGAYLLTTKGRDFIVHRYENPLHAAHTIYLIVIKNGSSYLVRTRKVQPLLGYTGFVHGEPVPGIEVVASAKQRLFDKTGQSVELTVKGTALITQFLENELQSFSHAVILYGETEQDEIIEHDKTGINSWSTLEDTSQLLPSCHDIIEMIERGESWLEKAYHL